MKTHLRMALGGFAGFGLGAFMMGGAHAQAAPPVYEGERMLGPTSADATGKDFIDAKGRRWIAVGKVVPKEINLRRRRRTTTAIARHLRHLLRPYPSNTWPKSCAQGDSLAATSTGSSNQILISLRRFFLGGRLGRQTASARRIWLRRCSL
jgi:hypothetical protein